MFWLSERKTDSAILDSLDDELMGAVKAFR
jgi:hypothetical protein